MTCRIRHRNAPVEAGARDAEILQPAFDEANDLVAAAFGADEVGIVTVKLEQRLLILGQAEEPGFLRGPLDRSALWRQLFAPGLAGDQLAFVVKCFVAYRVPALVSVEIQVPRLFHRSPNGAAGVM